MTLKRAAQYADETRDHIISDKTLMSIDSKGHLTGASYEFLDTDTVRVTWNDLGEDDSTQTFRRIP